MPVPFQFDKLDILRTFLGITSQPISRSELVALLDIGEGSLKTILQHLKGKKLIMSHQTGHLLTAIGTKKREQILSVMTTPQEISLSLYSTRCTVAILVKQPQDDIGYQHRDLAVKCGAEGALLFVYKEGHLILPYGEHFSFSELEQVYPYTEGDVLIITFGKEKKCVYRAALSIAQKLIPPLEEII